MEGAWSMVHVRESELGQLMVIISRLVIWVRMGKFLNGNRSRGVNGVEIEY